MWACFALNILFVQFAQRHNYPTMKGESLSPLLPPPPPITPSSTPPPPFYRSYPPVKITCVKVKYHTFSTNISYFSYISLFWKDDLFISLAFPLPDQFFLHFPYNVLQINHFKCFTHKTSMSKIVKIFHRQTDRPTNLLIEAPPEA